MKKIVAYLPTTYPSIPRKTFETYVKLITEPIPDHQIVPFIYTIFPLDYNRNDAVDRMRSNETQADYIMFCDADQVFPENTISRLLAHCSDTFPVVTGIYFRKTFPHRCVAGKYSPWSADIEKKRKTLEANGFIAPDGSQTLYYKPLIRFDVIEPVDVFGMGIVLVRADVFKSLKQPYFKYTNCYENGDYTFVNHSEDMWFCSELKKSGIKTLCDPSIRAGHVTERVIGCSEAVEA